MRDTAGALSALQPPAQPRLISFTLQENKRPAGVSGKFSSSPRRTGRGGEEVIRTLGPGSEGIGPGRLAGARGWEVASVPCQAPLSC